MEVTKELLSQGLWARAEKCAWSSRIAIRSVKPPQHGGGRGVSYALHVFFQDIHVRKGAKRTGEIEGDVLCDFPRGGT